MTYKKATIQVLCFLIILFFSSHDAGAIGINIDKPHIKVTAAPGSAASETLSIKNDGDQAVAVSITVQDWAFDENNRVVVKDPGTTPYSCASWVDISPQEILIQPNKRQELTITVRVPKDAVGGHYAALSIEVLPPKSFTEGGIGSRIMTRMVALLLQDTEGKTNRAGSIPSFDVTPPEKNKPLIVDYQFKNVGNAYTAFTGTAHIIDKKGNIFGMAQSDRLIGVFPGDVKKDKIEWFGSLPKGEYDLVLTVKFAKDSLPIVKESSFMVKEDIN